MKNCRHCNSSDIIKMGHRDGQQKYKCRSCGKYQGAVDRREKFSEKEKQTALNLYLEGNGFRRIARLLTDIFEKPFTHQIIQYWIKQKGRELAAQENLLKKEAPIVEMDELYTNIKKVK